MLLDSEYHLLILAERREAENVGRLVRERNELERQGLTQYSGVDFSLRLARRRLEAVSRLLSYNAGATSEDVRAALNA